MFAITSNEQKSTLKHFLHDNTTYPIACFDASQTRYPSCHKTTPDHIVHKVGEPLQNATHIMILLLSEDVMRMVVWLVRVGVFIASLLFTAIVVIGQYRSILLGHLLSQRLA